MNFGQGDETAKTASEIGEPSSNCMRPNGFYLQIRPRKEQSVDRPVAVASLQGWRFALPAGIEASTQFALHLCDIFLGLVFAFRQLGVAIIFFLSLEALDPLEVRSIGLPRDLPLLPLRAWQGLPPRRAEPVPRCAISQLHPCSGCVELHNVLPIRGQHAAPSRRALRARPIYS